jgi:hypothetical protein
MNEKSCKGGSCGTEHPGQGGGGPHMSTPEFDGSGVVAVVLLLVAMVAVFADRRSKRA